LIDRKSTLIAALSGTTQKGSKDVSGSVWIDSKDDKKTVLSISSGDIALLQQHDAFFDMLTAREVLSLATFLQLNINHEEQQDLVDHIMDSLGLRHVESNRIGSQAGSGSCRLSGGERRRLSVALELVSTPRIFVADEPTTGLDSSQAKKVFDIIADAAKERNIPCICSIHQPRASIWKRIDSFILLAPGGKMIYMGDRDKAIVYFSRLGYKCPPETTPAEFFIDLVTIDTEDKDVADEDLKRIEYLATAFQQSQEMIINQNIDFWAPPDSTTSDISLSNRRHNRPFFRRLAALFRRSLRQNFRDFKVNCLRSLASLGLARLFSELFSGVKKGTSLAKSVADRTAILSFGVINMTMMSLMKTLNLFGKEKNVVSREQMRNHYTSFDYLITKAAAEFPLDMVFSTMFAAALKHFTCLRLPLSTLCGTFSLMTVAAASLGFAIGSFTDGVDEAMTVGMPIMVVLMAVGIINPSGVDTSVKKPWYIQLLQKFSPIGMAIESLVIAEYKGMKFDDDGQRWRVRDLPKMGGLALVRNGDQVVDALGLSSKTYNGVMWDLATVSAFNLVVSWIGLSLSCGSHFTHASGETPILETISTIEITKR